MEGIAMLRLILTMVVYVGFVLSANAVTISGGKITAVNEGAKSFDCHWMMKDWTFKTNHKTVIKIGRRNAGWPDMKAGETINAKFHKEGDGRVAERIGVLIGVGF
jgi:hypothetical protein